MPSHYVHRPGGGDRDSNAAARDTATASRISKPPGLLTWWKAKPWNMLTDMHIECRSPKESAGFSGDVTDAVQSLKKCHTRATLPGCSVPTYTR